MSRGRPRHPDILTPREWEVLALIREGLSDPQIAERLQISLDGAKYHVSEILARLEVSTREQAAAWEPPMQQPSHGWVIAMWKIGLAIGASGAIAGLSLLAVGVFTNGTPDGSHEPAILNPSSEEPAARALPTPGTKESPICFVQMTYAPENLFWKEVAPATLPDCAQFKIAQSPAP
jgi:DNA-binding CsgD family transcriptional regulator